MSGSWSHTPSEWLSEVARHLGAADPLAVLGDELSASLPRSFDDPIEAANALVPGHAPLELSFCELQPTALRLDFEPLEGTPTERHARMLAALTARAAERFGHIRAERWATCVRQAGARPDGARFGAFVGAAIDAHGLHELTLYTPWHTVRGAAAVLACKQDSGFEPLMHSVAVGDRGVDERSYLVARSAIDLSAIEELLGGLDLAHRAPELLLTLLRLLDGPKIMPPGSLVVGLREGPDGVEVKLELMLGALGVVQPLSRVAALLAERPEARIAYERWLAAAARADAETVAGVISVRIAPSHGSRFSVYAHPEAISSGVHHDGHAYAA